MFYFIALIGFVGLLYYTLEHVDEISGDKKPQKPRLSRSHKPKRPRA
jgi:hypothetical protein